MKSLKIALYVALAFVAMTLWNNWQKEHQNTTPTVINQVIQPNGATTISTGLATPSLAKPAAPDNPITNLKKTNTVTVQTDVLNLTIDPSRGIISEARLLAYPESLKDKNPVTLLNSQSDQFYIAQSSLTGVTSDGTIPFTADQSNYTLAKNQNTLDVIFTWHSPDGLVITKTYSFKRGSYAIQVQYSINNNSAKDFQSRLYMQTQRLDLPPPSDHLVGFHTFFGVATSSPTNPYEKFEFKKLAEKPISETIQGGWLAFLQHYFLTAWIPDAKQPFYYYSQDNGNHLYTAGMISDNLTVAPGKSLSTSSQFYVGPELADQLQPLSPHLAMTIDYGWLWIISVAIFWLMKHIYHFVGNWGWSIVLVTLLIKLAFYKLSETSYKSMARMRALQPKINALKDRFGDDKQQFHRATMELYQKEKVNPLGGCLPILIQIPVFIALYWVLVESVELRQAPFIFWIKDLAIPDPYFILPIVMGITMFIQQKLSPAPADPMQAKVMLFLPLIFTVFFLGFPAGLVLYWVVNNAVSILQQWYITKRFEEGAYKKKGSKKS